jgi:hypothetical protein
VSDDSPTREQETDRFADRMIAFDERNDELFETVGPSRYRALEEKYAADRSSPRRDMKGAKSPLRVPHDIHRNLGEVKCEALLRY